MATNAVTVYSINLVDLNAKVNNLLAQSYVIQGGVYASPVPLAILASGSGGGNNNYETAQFFVMLAK